MMTLRPAELRQFAWITAGAIAVFIGFRALPTGTSLSHMDFRVDARGANSIEFCDPLNPQFIPVVAVRSPVTMSFATDEPTVGAGRPVRARIGLRTGSGKPIRPEDILVTHTRRLHLLLVDPTLADYQHVHPEPSGVPGEWAFAFTPLRAGTYRIFGDFTPAATGRGLYASVDLAVGPGTASLAANGGGDPALAFALVTTPQPVRVGQPIDLRFSVTRHDGGIVALEPVMGAFAHLVAFDVARSGFAHLHPAEADVTIPPDPIKPQLNFKLTIPQPGRYVVWAQVNVAGSERFVPFTIEVGR